MSPMLSFGKRKATPSVRPPFVRKSFRSYQFPEGRTADSFTYKVELLWGHVIDELWTDERTEVDDIIVGAHEELYDARVVSQDGTVEEHPCPTD